MKVKMIAIGNVLMRDDGIAIVLATELIEALTGLGIQVIFGETDPGYCISMVEQGDYLILLDATCLGKTPGEVSSFPLFGFPATQKVATQHSCNFLDLLKLYYPNTEGSLIGIEIAEIGFHYGLSLALKEKEKEIAREVLEQIKKLVITKQENGRQ